MQLTATSETSASNLYSLMKGKREIQISGWVRVSSAKAQGTKLFSLPSGYVTQVNVTVLAVASGLGTVIPLWCDQNTADFATQHEIAADQYYIIPVPIQLKAT